MKQKQEKLETKMKWMLLSTMIPMTILIIVLLVFFWLCGLFELSIIEQLYTDAVRCRSQLLPGRSFPRKKLKSKGRSHFRNKKASF